MAEETVDNGGTTTTTGETTTTTEATTSTATTQATPAAEVVYAFTAPEGIELDTKATEQFTTLAKDLKLPADKAQSLVDIAVGLETARREAHAVQVAKWADEVKGDKVIGGDKLPETLATAAKVYSLLPAEESEQLKGMLNASGFGSHPSVVRLFHTIGKALSEDRFITSSKAAGAETSLAQRMFPDMNP